MAMRRIVIESVIFSAKRKSRIIGGNGIIITTRTVITPITVNISLAGAGGFESNVKSFSII
jgi:hypothetical protein